MSTTKFGDFQVTESFNPTYQRIAQLGLEQHVLEIDAYGFTVIPPEKVAPPEFLERMRETVLQIARERTGVALEFDKNGDVGKYQAQPQLDNQFLLYYLLMADRIFEEWILNPTLSTLVDYLCHGEQQLSSLTSFIKWKGDGYGENLGLHVDSPIDRDGHLPMCSDACVSNYCLTDYTLANGCLAMVPGSFRYCREPKAGEGAKDAIPVECPKGSLIIWHGNSWHGAYPKETDGLRVSITTHMSHRRMKMGENYQFEVTEEMLDRNPPEFAWLVGADDFVGWGESGPDYSGIERYPRPERKK